MKAVKLIKSYNWRMLLMRIVVTMLSLLVTSLVVPKVMFVSPSLVDWFLVALVLGLVTALVKPIILFLTLRFIFATGGLVVVLVNAILLYLLAWLMPNAFSVSGLFWALVGGLVLGVSSSILEYLLGLTPPIVSEKYPEIRQKVKDRQFYRMQNELSRIEVTQKGSKGQLSVAKVMVVESSPTMAKLLAKDTDQPAQEQLESAAPEEPMDAGDKPPVGDQTQVGDQTPVEAKLDSVMLGEQILALTEAAADAREPETETAQPVETVGVEEPEESLPEFPETEAGREA